MLDDKSGTIPAPRGVDREIYNLVDEHIEIKVYKFPAPREVDRYLYRTKRRYILVVSVSAPSRDR